MSNSTTTIPARSWAFDAAIALGCAAISVSIVASITQGHRVAHRTPVLALCLAHALVLIWRRRAPWVVFGLNLATGLVALAYTYPMVVLGLAPVIALYSVASQAPRERSAIALVASIAFLLIATQLTDQSEDLGTIAGNALGLGGAWLVGSFVYARQFYVAQLEERTRQLENAREELAEQAVTQERLRIARELHDLVAHSLSLIAFRSGVAAHVMDEQPDEVRRSLETIEDVSRDALDEMRRMLSMLRNGDAERLPLPGLGDLDRLVSNVSESGLDVEVRKQGDDTPLPAALDLTAYRIVQESLTNVIKHAAASRARVVIERAADALTIEVVDDGEGTAESNGRGHGIVGMAERVQLFGGTLDAGALPEGGYRVRAVLPLGAAT